MNKNILKELIRIANELDAAGFHKEAAEIDSMMDADAASAALAETISREHESKPATLSNDLPVKPVDSLPTSVRLKKKDLEKKVKTVVMGVGNRAEEALRAAHAELAKLAPGAQAQKMESVIESGKVYILLGI